VYAVSSERGELVLRVSPDRGDDSHWHQQLTILRRAAERGVAPPIVHIDESARAIVSIHVPGKPLTAALLNPAQRDTALASVVTQLRTLHSVDAGGIVERDPVAYARSLYAAQRARTGFPGWAGSLEPRFDEIGAMLARDRRRVVSHNDLNPGNVVWDGARAWLIDWEAAGLSHPFYDLAALAMFIRLDDATAYTLLEQHEQEAPGDEARATFAALRRIAALLCGLVFGSTVPDLSVLPSSPPTLAEFYAQLRAGAVDLADPRGRGAFALALLREGAAGSSPRPGW
jgi:aminoglycoside phosphotransferase (APT) family kinase protein